MNSFVQRTQPWKHVDVSEATVRTVFDGLGISSEAVKPDARVLDFGCGNGRYMKVFSHVMEPSRIYGVDVDSEAFPALVDMGFHCAKLPERGVSLSFDDGMFDYVFSSNVVEHIPRPQYLNYLDEIFRVMKPGGVFAIGAPNYPIKRLFDLVSAWRHRRQPDMWRYYFYDDPTHVNPVSVRGVASDLGDAGFVDIDLLATELPLQSYGSRLRSKTMKRTLKVLGNKFFGSCRKPA